MDRIYTINLSSSSNSLITNEQVPSSLSIKNLYAYSIDFSIYVIALEKPNEVFEVCELKSECEHLEWSDDGKYLLSLSKDGNCMLHSLLTNGQLSNQFNLVYSHQLTLVNSSDSILIGKWLNKSPKIHFNIENKNVFNYHEKFLFVSYSVVKTTHGNSNNGFLLVSKTGMIYLFIIDFNSVKNQVENFEFQLNDFTNTNEMSSEANYFDMCDLTYDQYGTVYLACTKYDCQAYIYLYCIKFDVNTNGVLDMQSELKSTISVAAVNEFKTKLSILFPIVNNPNLLMTCLSTLDSSHVIQIWQCMYEQPQEQQEEAFETWNLLNVIQCPSNISQITMPKMTQAPIDLAQIEMDFGCIILSYTNGQLGLVDRLNFNQILIDFNSKRFVSLQSSHSGLVTCALTCTNNLILMSTPQVQSNINYYVNLLELHLISGLDNWEIIMNARARLNNNDLLSIVDSLKENYKSQMYASIKRLYHIPFQRLLQQFYFHLLNTNTNGNKSIDHLIRIEISRCSTLLSCSIQFLIKINDTTILLNDYLNDLFKPKQLSAQELLKLNINELVQLILNNRMTNQVSLNQKIKHVLQFSIDLTVHLICIIANACTILKINQLNQIPSQFHGVSLLNDVSFLNELRKMIVYSKVLFAVNNQNNTTPNNQSNVILPTINQQQHSFIGLSLPVLSFKSITSRDYLNDMFIILTKLIVNGCQVLDDTLIEQCIIIKTEAIRRPIDEYFTVIKQPWLSQNSKQGSLTMNVNDLFQEEKRLKHYPLFDVIRLVTFSRSQMTRQCIKCGCLSEANGIDKQNCTYIQEFASDGTCICGGLWVSSINA